MIRLSAKRAMPNMSIPKTTPSHGFHGTAGMLGLDCSDDFLIVVIIAPYFAIARERSLEKPVHINKSDNHNKPEQHHETDGINGLFKCGRHRPANQP